MGRIPGRIYRIEGRDREVDGGWAMEEQIRETVRSMEDELVEALQNLLRIPTVNPPGDSYEEFAATFREWLDTFGYGTSVVRVPDALLPTLAPHGEGRPRPSIIATLDGPGGDGFRIHLNGHYDVVPPGEDWSFPPFSGVLHEGKVYGRGAADQKSGLVMQVLAVEALRRAGVPWRGRITHSAVPDEETVGNRNAGTGYLVEQGIISQDNTDAVIITEPFGPDGIGVGHKGAIWGRITVLGRQAHGSSPRLGVNAVELLAEAIYELRNALLPRLRGRVSTVDVTPPESFDSSLSFDTFEGGVATNVIPARAVATFNRRLIPGETVAGARAEMLAVLEAMAAKDAQFRYVYDELYTVEPTLVSPKEPLPALFREVLEGEGLKPQFLISAGSDDQRFIVHGASITNSIVYGPGQTGISHQSDEHIRVADLIQATEILALALYRLLR